MESSTAANLSCLTSDLVASRAHSNRGEVQERIEKALEAVNSGFSQWIAVPFAITLGDEWQGLLSSPAAALEVDFHLRLALRPLSVASGIGVGPTATPVRERTSLMDGPCFHRSREALNRARGRRGSATVLLSGEPLLDDPVNAICLLLHAVSSRWTARQFDSLAAYLEKGTEVAAAQSLGVTQPTLHQSLGRSQAKVFLEAQVLLRRFTAAYPLREPIRGQQEG